MIHDLWKVHREAAVPDGAGDLIRDVHAVIAAVPEPWPAAGPVAELGARLPELDRLCAEARGEDGRYLRRLQRIARDLAAGTVEAPRPKRTQFWGADEDDDSLVVEILEGLKKATVCKADEYYQPFGDLDDGCMEPGDTVDVYDLRRRLRCRIRVTDVYTVQFGHIPERLWREGVCRDAEHFRQAHRDCWPDYDLTDDFEMVATHFEQAP